MRDPVDVAHLESTISRIGCKGMKKPNRLRFGRLSGFQAVAELLDALRIIWQAFLPFALLWWNAILCACCARYYSWYRSRFRLDCAGHQVLNDSLQGLDVKAVKQGLHRRHQLGDVLLGKLACDHRISCTHSSYGQAIELVRLPEQKEISLRDLERNDMYADDLCADNIALNVEKAHRGDKEHNTDVCIISCAPDGSKSIQVSVRSDASKLSSLHLFAGNIEEQSGLLKAAHWAAHLCLIPTEIPSLAKGELFGGPDISSEYFWMQLSLHSNKKLLDGKFLTQPPLVMCIDQSSLVELLLVSMMIFFSSTLLTFDGKKNAYLVRQILKYMISKAGFMDRGIMELVSSLFHDNDLDVTRTAVSLETLKGFTDFLSPDLGRRRLPAPLSDLQLKNYLCRTPDEVVLNLDNKDGNVFNEGSRTPDEVGLNLDNEDGNVFDRGSSLCQALSQPCDGYSCNGVSDICSDLDPIQKQISRNSCESGEAPKVLYEISQFENNGCHFSDKAANWDVNDGCSHWLEEEDGVWAGFYEKNIVFVRDDTYFQGRLGNDDVCSNCSICDNGDGVLINSLGRLGIDDVGSSWSNRDIGDGFDVNSGQVLPKASLADTWWDEDAVLIDEQKWDEDLMDQTWQVV